MKHIARWPAVIAAALSLAGCAAAKPPAATEDERKEALQALNVCLSAAARKLDDGKSDASTIALALRPSCAAEFARSRDVFGRELNPAAARMYHRTDDDAFVQVATSIVLHERAKRSPQ
jgi:hypothetical protein